VAEILVVIGGIALTVGISVGLFYWFDR